MLPLYCRVERCCRQEKGVPAQGIYVVNGEKLPLFLYILLTQGQRRYLEAEALLKQALSMQERVLGTDHPDTQRTRVALTTLDLHFQPEEKGASKESKHTEGAG